MTKKKTTESKEAIRQEVDRRFKDVRTLDDIIRLLGRSGTDTLNGKISPKLNNAISRRAGQIRRDMERQLSEGRRAK